MNARKLTLIPIVNMKKLGFVIILTFIARLFTCDMFIFYHYIYMSKNDRINQIKFDIFILVLCQLSNKEH